MPDFYTLITDVGQTKLASAIANNTAVQINEFSVGDGGGTSYDPTSGQTNLINEVFRDTVNRKFTDLTNAANAVIECIIPESVGGWYIREVGLYDSDGDLFAIAKYPPTFKPDNSSSLVKRFIVQMILAVVNADNVSITTNAAGVVTQDYLDNLHSSTTVIGITRYSTDAEALIMEEASAALTPSNLSSVLGHKVATSAATGVTGTAMTLNGTLLSLGLVSPSFNVGFDYRMIGQPNFTRTALTAKTTIGAFSVNLTGLLQNTTYEFKAVAVDPATTRTVYGTLITVTTPNTSPSDYTINVVGATDGTLNDPLNTTTVNAVANGYVDNVNALVIATADNCTAATKEYAQLTGDPDFVSLSTSYQFAPLKLAIDAATTNSSIVVTSPKAGLLTNGGALWVDDGGTMKDVTAANVVETKVSGTPTTAMTNGLGNALFCSFVDGGETYTVYAAFLWNLANGFYRSYLNIGRIGAASQHQTIESADNYPTAPVGATIYEYSGVKYLAVAYSDSGVRVFKWDSTARQFVRLSASDGSASGANYTICTINLNGVDYVATCVAYTWMGNTDTWMQLYTIGANGKLTSANQIPFSTSLNFHYQIKPFYYAGVTHVAYQYGGSVKILKYVANAWQIVQTIANRISPVVTTGSDGVLYLASAINTAQTSTIEIRKWDGVQFSTVTGITNAINYPSSYGYGSCPITYQGQNLFGFDNYLVGDFADISKYTCTGITPALTNPATWAAKAGQTFASSVIAASGAPSYISDTVATTSRSGDMLIITTADRAAAGRYIRLQIGLNSGDTASRFYAGFLV